MSDDNISKSLELLRNENLEIKNSKEYRVGYKIVWFLDSIKKFKLFKFIKQHILLKKVAKFNANIPHSKSDYDYGELKSEELNKKFVVYSCITGNYDNIEEPLFLNKNIDYILFTDNLNIKSKNWIIKPIPKDIQKLNNNVLINRYIKFKPHEIFSKYDYSLYVDGNMQVISDIRNMIHRINNKSGLAFHYHNSRNCAYDEAKVCLLTKKGNADSIKKMMATFQKNGFPSKFGLYEANIILCDLKNKNASTILNLWWDEFMLSNAYRDQLILPYAVWKLNFKFQDIGCLGHNVNKNPKFKKLLHK